MSTPGAPPGNDYQPPDIPPSPPGAEENRFDFRRYLHIIRKRLWLILLVTGVSIGIAAFLTSRMPDRYRAEATVVVHLQPARVLGKKFNEFDADAAGWWQGTTFLKTQLEILRSGKIARLAVDKLQARHRHQLAGKKAGQSLTEADNQRVADVIRGACKIEPQKDSRKFTVSAEHNNPHLARAIANAMVDAYVDYSLVRRRNSSSVAEQWLGDRLDQLEDKLKQTEETLQGFRRKHGLLSVSLEGRLNEVSATIIALIAKRNELLAKRIVLAARMTQLKRVRRKDAMKDPLVNMVKNPVIEGLKKSYLEQYSKLVELRSQYLEKHPKIQAQEGVVASIRRDMQREAELVLIELRAKYRALADAESRINAELLKSEEKGMELGNRALDYRRLERKSKQSAKYYELVLSRYTESGLAKQLKTNNVSVLDRARTPGRPFAPRLELNLAIALAIGLILGLGLVFLLFFMDNTVKSQEDVESLVGLPFLGYLPTIKEDAKSRARRAEMEREIGKTPGAPSPDLYLHYNPKSQVAEHCRSIRTNLLFMSPDKPLRAILVTSAVPREGKTTVAINIATSMAMSGEKTLIIDTDMRRPRVGKALGVSSETGISTALVSDVPVLDLVKETEIENLFCLPCGPTPPNPAELLHSKAFHRVSSELIDHFDRVVFDSPPVGAVTDPVILSKTVDGTILVVKSGVTVRQMLRSAGRVLLDVKAKVLGCILNDIDPQRRAYGGAYTYYYYRRRGYYSYYGDSPE